MYFELNVADVRAELFDNEVLAINLSSGYYYSMRLSAVPFWQMIVSGCSFNEAVAGLAHFYSVDETFVQEDFTQFLKALLQNSLVKEMAAPEKKTTENYQQYCVGAYEKPVLENYADMTDLLLLDPIHEVDITGWPNKKGQG